MSRQNEITRLAARTALQFNDIADERGDLTALQTTLKTSLVAAINEVLGNASTNAGKIGTLANLGTTAKANLVVALNELKAAIDNATNIDDNASGTDTTYSSSKINQLLNDAINGLLGPNVAASLDTLKEIGDYLAGQATELDSLLAALNKRVRFDAAQTLTGAEQTQARSNIGAVAAADVGDTDHDFVADFEAALT